ncbi:SMC-Scp complex subunit ScpB [Falsarthrobacter nasiphocae]|uniref:Segregation and condensation protein B n=1 Tax=Falsarthrobacter nasiphocae TaxID=189863 RepID=A0AAE3YES8_9MICC|nr:SMC-Scp complex subunit ScpB [Falsarthrobacter nasiphocae]MDR6891377.1 segregation and condensation protein B [Falsarthrobacter nasiphocae]
MSDSQESLEAGLSEGLLAAVEAVLMVADGPVSAAELARALDEDESTAEAAIAALQAEYAGGAGARPRGFEIRRSGGGWRVYARPEHREVVERFVLSGQRVRLSQAALETLAVIAYRQPVARSEVAAIRGVNVDSVVKTLQHRELIDEQGVHPATGATLYGTTRLFLERLGIESLEELPQISPLLPGVGDLEEIETGEPELGAVDAAETVEGERGL